MPRVGFEPTISAGERPKTYALDRAATWTGQCFKLRTLYLDILARTGFLSYSNAVRAQPLALMNRKFAGGTFAVFG